MSLVRTDCQPVFDSLLCSFCISDNIRFIRLLDMIAAGSKKESCCKQGENTFLCCEFHCFSFLLLLYTFSICISMEGIFGITVAQELKTIGVGTVYSLAEIVHMESVFGVSIAYILKRI